MPSDDGTLVEAVEKLAHAATGMGQPQVATQDGGACCMQKTLG